MKAETDLQDITKKASSLTSFLYLRRVSWWKIFFVIRMFNPFDQNCAYKVPPQTSFKKKTNYRDFL